MPRGRPGPVAHGLESRGEGRRQGTSPGAGTRTAEGRAARSAGPHEDPRVPRRSRPGLPAANRGRSRGRCRSRATARPLGQDTGEALGEETGSPPGQRSPVLRPGLSPAPAPHRPALATCRWEVLARQGCFCNPVVPGESHLNGTGHTCHQTQGCLVTSPPRPEAGPWAAGRSGPRPGPSGTATPSSRLPGGQDPFSRRDSRLVLPRVGPPRGHASRSCERSPRSGPRRRHRPREGPRPPRGARPAAGSPCSPCSRGS